MYELINDTLFNCARADSGAVGGIRGLVAGELEEKRERIESAACHEGINKLLKCYRLTTKCR